MAGGSLVQPAYSAGESKCSRACSSTCTCAVVVCWCSLLEQFTVVM